MRVAILGCGGIAPRHVAAIAKTGHTLVACVGRDAGRTAAFAAQHGGEPFTDLDRAIDATAPDIAVVTLPPFARSGEIEHIAERGVHLLVEKPLALDAGTAARTAAAVGASGVTAAIGFMYRHGDAVKAWRAADTGPVELYAGAYHCNALHAPWWRERAKSGGQIVEQVIHQIDLIRHLMGDPDTVYARAANLLHTDVPGYDVEDISTTLFSWDDGRIATLNASNIATPGVWHKEWAVYAQSMTGRFTSWNEAGFTLTVAGAETQVIAGTSDPFVAQFADLVAAIESGRPLIAPLVEGVGAQRLAVAAALSAKERREVRIADGL